MVDQQIIIFGIIFFTLCLFIFSKFRFDVVAIIALLLTTLSGIIPPREAFAGFSHPATITVALVLILSSALTKSGAIEPIVRISEKISFNDYLHVLFLTAVGAFLSMFMNNVGALALLMPIAIESFTKNGKSPALILMPLSFGTILGGLVTLIGTPSNIIISSYRASVMGEPYKMFDFSPVGGVLAIAGVTFISLIGWKLIKVSERKKRKDAKDLFEIESYLFEVQITEESKLLNKSIKDIESENVDLNILIVSLIHKRKHYYSYTVPKNHNFISGDILLLEGSHENIDKFITKYNVIIPNSGNNNIAKVLHSEDADTQEVVIAPMSRLEGRTVEQINFKNRFSINLLGVSRQGRSYRGRIKSLKIRVGDVLLLHGETNRLLDTIATLGCFPLAQRDLDFGKRKFALLSLLIFFSAITISAMNITPIYISFSVAVLFMILCNIISPKELYDNVDWSVIVLLGAMLPLGSALETTGATELLVTQSLVYLKDVPSYMILTLVLIITMSLSDILNNAATTILMAPVGKIIADQTATNPDPYFMAIAIGASCALLTPIGHQNNALVMGPGGYKFTDYWRLGLPLEILIVIISIPLIQVIWPL